MGKHVRPCSSEKLFSVLLLIQICSNIALAGSIVKFLPGFQGPLPFELETGYIGVDESEDVQLFYYFIKSESSPETDPLVLWLTGGPGCTSLSGLAYEIGPIKFEQILYHGTLPKLLLNPYSWTKMASIIFVDLPVGTGFSYARTAKASNSTDLQACDQAYEFLRKWLDDHPEFISNPVYVGGDSYSGITVPIVTQLISNGNELGIEPRIDLKGYLLGNPGTTREDGNYEVPFAHGMALISDELYESLKVNCKGEYQSIDPSNALCVQNMKEFNQLLNNIDRAHILEPNCPFASPKPNNLFNSRRSGIEMFHQQFQELNVQELTPITCRTDGYKLAYYWANDKSVQEALHVQKGTVEEWIRCNYDLPYTTTVGNSVPYHKNLSIKGYRSLIYSGDHDMLVPHFGTQAWIRSLITPSLMNGDNGFFKTKLLGCYTRTYANNMTFATIKGGGHTAPEYRPAECQAMFKRWISSQLL